MTKIALTQDDLKEIGQQVFELTMAKKDKEERKKYVKVFKERVLRVGDKMENDPEFIFEVLMAFRSDGDYEDNYAGPEDIKVLMIKYPEYYKRLEETVEYIKNKFPTTNFSLSESTETEEVEASE
jgi:hypothetical protein